MSLDVQLIVAEKQPYVLYSANITHNMGKTAGEAGIYGHLWYPNEIGITRASQLIQPLQDGLKLLRSDSERFKAFDPENGWGNYDGLCAFIVDYLSACERYPDSEVRVSR